MGLGKFTKTRKYREKNLNLIHFILNLFVADRTNFETESLMRTSVVRREEIDNRKLAQLFRPHVEDSLLLRLAKLKKIAPLQTIFFEKYEFFVK